LVLFREKVWEDLATDFITLGVKVKETRHYEPSAVPPDALEEDFPFFI
jgi:hypothetical protein